MTTVEADERGRITIPEGTRDQYGDEYRLIELRSSIKLVPIPEDPLEALRSAASEDLKSASMEDVQPVSPEVVREEVNPDADDE